MQRFTTCFLFIILMAGCSSSSHKSKKETGNNKYAHGFQIEKKENLIKLSVFNPWEKAEDISVDYYLLKKSTPLPDSLANKKVIRTPVDRVICLSTTHIAFLDALNKTNVIAGVSGSQYVSNSLVRKKINNGEVSDVGYGQNLNFEEIVNRQPELVMVYGIGSEVTSYTQKLEELGIPVILIAEYLEENPLGKTEWIKFISTLFEKEKEAEKYFSRIESSYNNLKRMVQDKTDKPKVLVGSPYKDTWWVPGGNSYMANLIADAGGDYLGKESGANESYAISFENALAWGSHADVWINMGNLQSKKDIRATNERFASLAVFKEGRIYNKTKRLGSHGGNDFWESGTVHPDWILRDLIAIFYPETVDTEMVYYEEIK